MDTRDLTSYYPGYDDRDGEAKVPYEDYAKLEEKIEIYKKNLEDLENTLYQKEYKESEMITESKKILKVMKEELENV